MLVWPESQLFLSGPRCRALAARCEPGFVALGREMQIEEDLRPYLASLYLPLAAWLHRRKRDKGSSLVIGLCGAQGSGKSTVAALLRQVMGTGFGLRVASFSIDDIYRTREERAALARRVHPLFATRGVPFTHDVALGMTTIRALSAAREGDAVSIPAFDKATDTRHPESCWPTHEGPCDAILLDGWCVGAVAEDPGALAEPVNALERDEDRDGAWRTRVNQALAAEYQRLYALLDVLILLQVEGMHRVFQWRRLQERKLAARAGKHRTALAIMSAEQVDRFVMHYERLTRHILVEMPARADVVLAVDGTHNPATVHINHPLAP